MRTLGQDDRYIVTASTPGVPQVRWVIDYNGERPHSSLKYQTPAAYAATFTATGDRLRNPDQLRRSPVAPPAPIGVKLI